MFKTIMKHICTLGIPAIIRAIAEARRKKREQKARLKKEKCQDDV